MRLEDEVKQDALLLKVRARWGCKYQPELNQTKLI